MHRVDDWISNLYPNGYSFSHFKSNFTSAIYIEFGIKANDFEGCKMEQDVKDHIENIKKQRDYLLSYLSEIAINIGGTAKVDLKKIEKGLIHIEADLRTKGHATSQVIKSGRNRRTFQSEEKCEEKCGICNRKGHTERVWKPLLTLPEDRPQKQGLSQ